MEQNKDPVLQETEAPQKKINTNKLWVYEAANGWICLEDATAQKKLESLKEAAAVDGELLEQPESPPEAPIVSDQNEVKENQAEVEVKPEEDRTVYTLIEKFDIVQEKKLYLNSVLGLCYVEKLKDKEAEVITKDNELVALVQ